MTQPHHPLVQESKIVRSGTDLSRATGAVYGNRIGDRPDRPVADRVPERGSMAAHVKASLLRVAFYLAIAAIVILIWAAITTHGFTVWPTYWDKMLFQLEVQNFEPSRARSSYS